MQKTVLIAGGSSGIGLETAKLFQKDGSKVYNLSRTKCDLAGVTNICCDIADRNQLLSAIQTLNKLPAFDIFIYSAGFSMASPLEYVEESDYRYLYEVNFFGFLALTKALLPKLRERGGCICAISSMGGITPIAYDSFYSSSKAALNMMISSLRLELAPQGVKVISVLPGGTATRFTYKRKIYPVKDMECYKEEMEKAVDCLHDIEQHGMKPSAVAKTIYRKCTKNCLSQLYASGFMNKLMFHLQRILPQSMQYLIGRSIYF